MILFKNYSLDSLEETLSTSNSTRRFGLHLADHNSRIKLPGIYRKEEKTNTCKGEFPFEYNKPIVM